MFEGIHKSESHHLAINELQKRALEVMMLKVAKKYCRLGFYCFNVNKNDFTDSVSYK